MKAVIIYLCLLIIDLIIDGVLNKKSGAINDAIKIFGIMFFIGLIVSIIKLFI